MYTSIGKKFILSLWNEDLHVYLHAIFLFNPNSEFVSPKVQKVMHVWIYKHKYVSFNKNELKVQK